MSATRGSAGRVGGEFDDYSTPRDLCTAAVDWLCASGYFPLRGRRRPRLLEPSAGDGNFLWAMANVLGGPELDGEVHAVDIEREQPDMPMPGQVAWLRGDFLQTEFCDGFDLICGNPPYGRVRLGEDGAPVVSKKTGKPVIDPVAALHVERALKLLNPGGVLAFVLRMGFFETARHELLLARHPVTRIIELSPRPRFVGRGDSAPYCLAIWRLGHVGPATFEIGRWSVGG